MAPLGQSALAGSTSTPRHTTQVTSPDSSSSRLGSISPVKPSGPAPPAPPAGGGFAALRAGREGWGAPDASAPLAAPPELVGDGVQGSGFRVQGSGFGVGVRDVGFRDYLLA